jgi:multimeric flavodoxin WrbA
MLDYFIKGIKENSNIEVEKIYLEDILINPYNYENSQGPEEEEQEFKELTNKIGKGLSGLIIATPTYNFSVPAHLKNFIDRIRFLALDLKNKNKLGQPKGNLGHLKTYFLISGGTPNWAEKILFFAFPAFWLRGVFLYFNAQVMGAYYSGDINTFKNKKILTKCFNKGKRYGKKIIKNKGQGILEKIFFRPPQIR